MRGERRTRVPGAQVLYTIVLGMFRGTVCVFVAATPNCRILPVSLGTLGNAPSASMPTAGHPLCIFACQRFGNWRLFMAFAVGQLFFGVY